MLSEKKQKYLKSVLVLVVIFVQTACSENNNPWTWICQKNQLVGKNTTFTSKCSRFLKDDIDSDVASLGLNECKMTCGEYGALWPRPKEAKLSKKTVGFYQKNLVISRIDSPNANVRKLVSDAVELFFDVLKLMRQNVEKGQRSMKAVTSNDLIVEVSLSVKSRSTKLTWETDESYTVKVARKFQNVVGVDIEAETFFGARHGLETVSQLISAHDDDDEKLQILETAEIADKPKYPHRGILVDTSRHFVTVETIKKILDGMSYNKLNYFHWHITDSHSFPFFSRSHPEFTKYGAYSKYKIYHPRDIKEIVEYGKVRGVRVYPEFDAPAHAGNGWQWAEKKGLGRLAVCVNQEPWQSYCVEPPCGQLNVANENLYPVLADIYHDMFTLFEPDIFHVGGDEVNVNCWNTTEEIVEHMEKIGKSERTEDDFYDLWSDFQNRSTELIYEANDGVKVPIVIWTSHLTQKAHVSKYLDNEIYVIQDWSGKEDDITKELVRQKFRVILSNHDAWYLDCGFSAWVGEGNNWCSPYKGWQIMYDHNPRKIMEDYGESDELVLGGETAMWSEQVDTATIEGKLWPRSAAMAESLWSNLDTTWFEAEFRMIHQRERLVQRGIKADALQPEWCHQNEGHCYVE